LIVNPLVVKGLIDIDRRAAILIMKFCFDLAATIENSRNNCLGKADAFVQDLTA
jgi:hypothetical protein